jgi:hypothetical protein
MAEHIEIEVPDSELRQDQQPFDRLKEILELPDLPRSAVQSSYYDPIQHVTVFKVVI